MAYFFLKLRVPLLANCLLNIVYVVTVYHPLCLLGSGFTTCARRASGRPASAFPDMSGRAHAPRKRESWRCGGVARLVVACLSRQEVH